MEVLVKPKAEKNDAWVFEVAVDGTEYRVSVPRGYPEALAGPTGPGQTGRKMAPEELVRRSFDFLLAREPKGSILREFDLPVIQTYFPEYESEMRAAASARRRSY